MSRMSLAVAAIALLALPLIPRAAHGQTKFSIAAGASSPTGSFGNNVEIGYHVMGSMQVLPPLAPVGFRLDGMFNEFSYTSPLANGNKARILAATGNAMITSPGIMGPYLIGGIGIYNSSSTAAGSRSTRDLGYNIGAGFRFALSGFSAFSEARFHYVGSGTGNPRFIPITFGLTF